MHRFLRLSLGFSLALISRAEPTVQAPPAYVVRVAYVIPSDRQPTADYAEKATRLMGYVRRFYADQMQAHGFGPATFELEKGADDKVAVHLIPSPLTTEQFVGEGHVKYAVGNYWKNAETSLRNAGYPPYRRGEVWMVFAESQTQRPDGSMQNGTSQGIASMESGMCLCDATALSVATPRNLSDLREYDGLVIPELGPNRLVKRKSFPYYEGDYVSSITGSFVGAVAHELGHCFQLFHCGLNDDAQNGNLMGNGFRAWRGYAMPKSCPNEDIRLDRASALALRLSPFFRPPGDRVKAGEPPRIDIVTPSGDMKLEGGKFRFVFTAAQPKGPGLALATLENGMGTDRASVVAWREFPDRPKKIAETFETARILPGSEQQWRVRVFDAAGNVSEQIVRVKAPSEGFAPQPTIFVAQTRVKAGDPVRFTGSAVLPGDFDYRWSFSEGPAMEGRIVTRTFRKSGVYEVRLRATDREGRFDETTQTISVTEDGPASIFAVGP